MKPEELRRRHEDGITVSLRTGTQDMLEGALKETRGEAVGVADRSLLSDSAATPTASAADLEGGSNNVGVAEWKLSSGCAPTSTLSRTAPRHGNPMRSHWSGVPDVAIFAGFARTSDSVEVLEQMVHGGREVDASDFDVVSGSAEAPTSLRRRALMRKMDGGCGLGGRFWTRTSILRAPATHHRTRKRNMG